MKPVKTEVSGLELPGSLRFGVCSFFTFLLLSQCAATSAPVMQFSVPAPPESLRFQVGTVALAPPSRPAAFSFQHADGQIETAGDLAGVAAANVLNTTVIDPLLNWPWTAITFAAAPFAAANAALDSRARLTPDKLSECEADLLKAMREMAAQQQFHDCLLKSATEKCPGRLTYSGQ